MILTLPSVVALWFLPFALPIAAWVAWSDLARMRIPNTAVLSLCAVFLLIGPLVLPLDVWAWRWAHFGVALVAGFVLNAAGALGAGDAKFAAAMAPFVALADLGAVAILFAVMLLAGFAVHRLARATPGLRGLAPDWESWTRGDFPMGLPLAGTLVAYLIAAAVSG